MICDCDWIVGLYWIVFCVICWFREENKERRSTCCCVHYCYRCPVAVTVAVSVPSSFLYYCSFYIVGFAAFFLLLYRSCSSLVLLLFCYPELCRANVSRILTERNAEQIMRPRKNYPREINSLSIGFQGVMKSRKDGWRAYQMSQRKKYRSTSEYARSIFHWIAPPWSYRGEQHDRQYHRHCSAWQTLFSSHKRWIRLREMWMIGMWVPTPGARMQENWKKSWTKLTHGTTW